MSSDCNAKEVEYPVLVNDALQGSVKLVLDELTAAIAEGKAAYVPKAAAPTSSYRPRSAAPRA